ncbi:Hsp20/alpha crystallin family protein [Halostella salina]|uniref:Hsp20/alpha crystallin family protein n=1 Tax=Halostella salina TaxID=1547897 RepID=UPI000EF7DBD9|nr:Hsp20/alpha crystallin family protein [Halostella salina]
MTLREIGKSVTDTVVKQVGRATSRLQESRSLAADVLESDDAVLVVFDAPGATGSDVQVRFADGAVLVRVDRFRDYHEGFEMLFPGRGLSLDGRAKLPDGVNVDAESATATLTDTGELHVHLPKAESDDGSAAVETTVDPDDA